MDKINDIQQVIGRHKIVPVLEVASVEHAVPLADYLAFANLLACGGSWMVKPSLYANGDFQPVEAAVRSAKAIVDQFVHPC